MDFRFLYNAETDLLAIGYNVSERRLDNSSYDLLASEARLASFVGIAQGQFPQEHWFALGRQLCMVGGEQLLLSWSGSMFEYLMPLLVMPGYRDTLLDQTYHGIIHAPDRLCAPPRHPLGHFGIRLQHRRRGDELPVPRLRRARHRPEARPGRRHGDRAVCHHDGPDGRAGTGLRQPGTHGQASGFTGAYGFYEAVDYTAARLPRGQDFAVVRSFMAHHQGMGFLALSYLLHDRPMQRRFEGRPQFQATLLLLQERVPKTGAFESSSTEAEAMRSAAPEAAMPTRVLTQPTAQPEVQLLSNGRYHVMVTRPAAATAAGRTWP
jgi:cyclic beta-1,2-glucan synthetase